MKKILNYIKNLFSEKQDNETQDQNDILFLIDLKIEELGNLKIQTNNYISNTEAEDINWVNYQNILSPYFADLFKNIVINNFRFRDAKFTEIFFDIIYLIQKNNFFIIIDENPIIIKSGDQKEIELFKIFLIRSHVYCILNKLIYINVSKKEDYAKDIIMGNLLFFLKKIENKNENLEKIIEKCDSLYKVNYILAKLNSHISFTEDNEVEDTLEIPLCISMVSIIESMRREAEEIKCSKKYYNKTDNCFAQYFNRKKSYKNLKSKSL